MSRTVSTLDAMISEEGYLAPQVEVKVVEVKVKSRLLGPIRKSAPITVFTNKLANYWGQFSVYWG